MDHTTWQRNENRFGRKRRSDGATEGDRRGSTKGKTPSIFTFVASSLDRFELPYEVFDGVVGCGRTGRHAGDFLTCHHAGIELAP